MKDTIEYFDVAVDITDCAQLYDYATCSYIQRTPLGWKQEQLTLLGQTEGIDNENLMMQVAVHGITEKRL